MHLTSRDKACEESCRHQGEEQGDTCRQGETYIEIFRLFLEHLRFIEDLFQSHHGQQRYREFRNHEDRGDGTELVVHRYIVEEEIGKAHEVLTP